MHMTNQRKYQVPGFTFMELVVSILILGILVGMSIVGYNFFVGRARETATKTNLRQIKSMIDIFYIEQGRYPTQIKDLVERPQGDLGKKWKPYLEQIPLDGWNRGFYYKVTPGGKHPYELYSYGDEGPDSPTEEGYISVWEV